MRHVSIKPLTALFLAATVLLDVVIAVGGSFYGNMPNAVIGFLIGQMCVAGAWLVSGRPHRLARAAAFVAAMVGLATTIVVAGTSRSDAPLARTAQQWGRAFAPVTVIAAGAAIASALCVFCLRRADRRRETPQEKLRFPLIEIFGWMIVVALASSALRAAEYAHLASNIVTLLFVLAGSAAAGITYTLLLGRHGVPSNRRIGIAIAAMLAFVAVSVLSDPQRDRDVHYGYRWAFLYLAALVAVDRLDRRLRTSPATEAPSEPLAPGELPTRAAEEELGPPF